MKTRTLGAAVATLAALALVVAPPSHGTVATTGSATATAGEDHSKFDEHLVDALADGPEEVDVIVTTAGDPAAAAEAAEALGASITWRYDIIDGFAGRTPSAALGTLAARDDVERIWLDRPVEGVMDVSHEAIEADKVWDTGVDGDSLTVAVIDTGIDRTHPNLAEAVVGCVSLIAGMESPECFDLSGHGTHVAGTVASRHEVRPGIAPGTNLAAVRTLHGPVGLSSDSIAGMEWIQENAMEVTPPIKVATMSLGPLDPGCGDGSDPSSQAADALVASGVVFTVAAGNSGHKDEDGNPQCTIDGAASAKSVITVGGVDDHNTVTQDDDTIYEDSSGGPTDDGRLKPEVVFPAVAIVSTFPYARGVLIASATGTSMATPHAAGTAALLLDDDPTLTTGDVKERITDSAYAPDNGAAGELPNNVWGHGAGNACRALGLPSCRVPLDTTRVDAVGTSSSHAGDNDNGRHEITVTATIVDDNDARLSEAEVSFHLTGPDGIEHSGTEVTDSAGVAVFTVHEPRGHGEWEACVTDVTAPDHTYTPDANDETCETFAVT